jgi:predicted O-methyltransferase YrrM
MFLRYLARVYGKYLLRAPRRYRVLLQEIRARRARTLLEIGVYRGIRAREMIEAALLHARPQDVRYIGFDLFEDLSDDLCVREFSKKPFTQLQIEQILGATGARIELHRGFSQETLPPFVETCRRDGTAIDLAFIDGGHAIATIRSDWENVEKIMGPRTVVLFDDYYMNDDPEVSDVGCRSLIDGLDRTAFDVRILGPEDCFAKEWGPLRIKLARVTRR